MENIWEFLKSVKYLVMDAHESAERWHGEAEVIVNKEAENIIFFDERGHWKHPARQPFHNTYCWRLEPCGTIRLHRKQMEEGGWTTLADFEKQGEAWLSRSPHLCGDDCYEASLSLEGSSILLNWSITGPKKSTTISARYT